MGESYHILINKNSGGALDIGSVALAEKISQSDVRVQSLDILEADAFFKKLDDLKDSEYPILVGGGDGTIRSCAEVLKDVDRGFGVIPLGTMNLMARDLKLPLELEELLAVYAGEVRTLEMDVGMVNDELFLCCVGIGTMPESSEFREENRTQNPALLMPRLTVFVLDQMDEVRHRVMRLTMDGKKKTLKTAALVVSNNQYQPQEEWSENNFLRPSLDNGKLGIYSAAPHSMWDRVRLITRLRFGNWRVDPIVKEWQAETLSLTSKRDEELISLDGETKRLKTPLNFWIERRALKMIVPAVEGEKI